MNSDDHACLTYPCAVCGEEGQTLKVGGGEYLTIEGNDALTIVGSWKTWRIKKRPETPEEALAIVQAWYDGGMTFQAVEGNEVAAAFDANPMLERADPPPQEET